MMQSNNANVQYPISADQLEMLNIQLHYSMFLTQKPIEIYLDSNAKQLDNDFMKHMFITKGNHTLTFKNPGLSLDET